MAQTTRDDSLSAVLALMSGHAVVRSLAVVTELGVPDLLVSGPRSSAELAAACSVDVSSLHRLLVALAAVGVLAETPAGFGLNTLSERLRRDHPQSLRDFILIRGHPMYWQAWGALDQAVRTGEAAFRCAHGVDHFDYLDRHPEAARMFHDGMRSLSGQVYAAVIETCDFSRADTIIDVGGGQGVLLAGVLRSFPKVRGMLLDAAAAIEQSGEVLRAAGVAERCRTVAGDFFAGIPHGADTAILSRILHNWSDADALRILRNCRAALPERGRLVIVEYVVTDDASGAAAKLFDLQMLVYFGRARERSAQEFRDLLGQAGFSLGAIRPTPVGIAIVEATAC
jgi:hypothetical protein